MTKSSPPNDFGPAIEILNRALTLEYSIVIHFPRISAVFKDRDIRDKALYLSTASVKHANEVASAIEKLGGKPEWSFEPFPDDDLVKLFETQIEKEHLAHELHLECVRLLPEGLKPKFREMAREEEWHAKVALEVCDYLKGLNADTINR